MIQLRQMTNTPETALEVSLDELQLQAQSTEGSRFASVERLMSPREVAWFRAMLVLIKTDAGKILPDERRQWVEFQRTLAQRAAAERDAHDSD